MANYTGCFRSNNFVVTDKDRFDELCKGLSPDASVSATGEENGYCIYGSGSFDWYPPVSENECKNCAYSDNCEFISGDERCRFDFDGCVDEFFDEMQKIIPADRAFAMFESGHESYRYVTGCVTVVTKDGGDMFLDLTQSAGLFAKEHGART